jgi:hypothetical protein
MCNRKFSNMLTKIQPGQLTWYMKFPLMWSCVEVSRVCSCSKTSLDWHWGSGRASLPIPSVKLATSVSASRGWTKRGPAQHTSPVYLLRLILLYFMRIWASDSSYSCSQFCRIVCNFFFLFLFIFLFFSSSSSFSFLYLLTVPLSLST